MTPERWERIEQLCHSALERAPRERAAYLAAECAGDAELQREVESLINDRQEGGASLERQAIEVAAERYASTAASDLAGRTLGRYEILSRLGAGGMGEVYLARDARLKREVALKVLPHKWLADAERKRRFEQEARAASALNHPNIVTVFDVDQVDGTTFIAMEYVPGKTLDQVIPRHGLPLQEVLKYAVEIARALAAAHSASIVHRDIKPSNVMVGGPGQVKVLDFGLAKLIESPRPSDDEPTRSLQPQTEEGAVVGTVSYMSPEQAQGQPVDARSDIFSFGALLYEMVTGRRAFKGTSKMSTLAAILNQEPAPLGVKVPQELEKVITRCLRKDPARRFQHMDDVHIALQELKEESSSSSSPQPNQAAFTIFRLGSVSALLAWGGALAVILGAATAFGLWFFRSRAPSPDAPLTAVPLTTYPGFQDAPDFSPDGNQVAFCWDGDKQDNIDIYLKLIGAGQALRLTTNAAADCRPAWSPDGRSIAFLRRLPDNRAAVMLISPLGGAEKKLAESSDFHSKPAWSPDGKWLVIADKSSPAEPDALFLLSMENGERRRLTTHPGPLGGDGNPVVSWDGRSLAFVRWRSRVFDGDNYAGDLYSLRLSDSLTPIGEPKRLTFDDRYISRPAWTPDSREILFCAGSFMSYSLWRMPADGSRKPRPMPSLGERLGEGPAVSHQRNRLAYIQASFDFNIWRLKVADPHDRTRPAGRNGTPFIASTRLDWGPRFSPDGKRIAFASGRLSRTGSSEIWVCDSEGSNQLQVTSVGADAANPSWSPDSEHIAFDSTAEGNRAIYIISANGGKPLRLTKGPADDSEPSWSRDGKWIYCGSNRSGSDQIWKMPVRGGAPVQVTRKGGITGFESADGKILYYAKSRNLYYAKNRDQTSIWRIPVDGGEETPVIQSLASLYDFAVTDRGIYFIPAPAVPNLPFSSIQFFDFVTQKISVIGTTDKQAEYGLTASPDGRSILYTRLDQEATELMLVEDFR